MKVHIVSDNDKVDSNKVKTNFAFSLVIGSHNVFSSLTFLCGDYLDIQIVLVKCLMYVRSQQHPVVDSISHIPLWMERLHMAAHTNQLPLRL